MYMFQPADNIHHRPPLLPLHHRLVKSGPLDQTLQQAPPHHPAVGPAGANHSPHPPVSHTLLHQQTGSHTVHRPHGRGHLDRPQGHVGPSPHHHTQLSPNLAQFREEGRPAGVRGVDPATSLIASFARPQLPPPPPHLLPDSEPQIKAPSKRQPTSPNPLVHAPQSKPIFGDIKPFVSFGGSHVPYSL